MGRRPATEEGLAKAYCSKLYLKTPSLADLLSPNKGIRSQGEEGHLLHLRHLSCMEMKAKALVEAPVAVKSGRLDGGAPGGWGWGGSPKGSRGEAGARAG